MGILDKLKRKKAATPAVLDPENKPTASPGTRGSSRAYAILIRPFLTEKATAHASTGRYVFEVARTANKSEVKKSIERVYEVHVRDVKIINLRGKKRRTGRTMGETSPVKKAIVVLRDGEKIPGIIESVG